MAVTNGKGGSLDFGTFRTAFRDEQHGDARWLNGTAEDEVRALPRARPSEAQGAGLSGLP